MMEKMVLYLDRVLYPVTSLGPGRRLAIWVAGCARHCPGCANPELWECHPEQGVPLLRLLPTLKKLLAGKQPDGITLTGGEPFDQAPALTALLCGLRDRMGWKMDVLCYSGYLREELVHDPERLTLLNHLSVLIDGPYLQEENQPSFALRGSANQRIWYEDEAQRVRYEEYLRLGRQVQNFVYDYRILSVGIHNPPAEMDGGSYE